MSLYHTEAYRSEIDVPKRLDVLIACEFSGVVRRAFRSRGHNAWSCDILPAEDSSEFHFCGDVLGFPLVEMEWDLMIAHPPCTYLASSGARWWKGREEEQLKALGFVHQLMNSRVPRVCIENPVGKISSHFRKPNQIIQPWQFGHGEVKTTCLWLKNLPPLQPTAIVAGREQKCWKQPPHVDRWKRRSRTYVGIAEAMALQWGEVK